MSADTRNPRRPRRGAGSQAALRAANTKRVVHTLREGGPTTQASLARLTGLSTATVSNLVRVLVDDGVVRTSATTSSGRRAVQVELSDTSRAKVALGVDIGRSHVRVVMCTSAREILADTAIALPERHCPRDTLRSVDRLVTDLLHDAALGREAVVGCGVGIPGPIDSRTGEVSGSVVLSEWAGVQLQSYVADELHVPVYVDNDANLGALAEVSWGAYRDVDDLIFVKVGSGIGSGLVLGGRLHRGVIGITGEVGHTNVTENGPICRCGSRGCLESVASTSAMSAQLAGADGPPHPDELIARALAGDPAAVRIIEDAGVALGRVLGGAVNLLNPQVIVIGGPLLPLGELFVDAVRGAVMRYAAPVIGGATAVVASSLGDRAEALGACSLVLRSAPDDAWF